MFPTLRRSRALIALLCIALVVLRVGGTHLHLCFDGSEPPVSLHVADIGAHHADDHHADDHYSDDHGATELPAAAVADFTHDDQDVGVGSDLVSKKLSGDVDLAVLAFLFALVLFLVPRRRDAVPEWCGPVSLPQRFHLRPPLRGPPLSR